MTSISTFMAATIVGKTSKTNWFIKVPTVLRWKGLTVMQRGRVRIRQPSVNCTHFFFVLTSCSMVNSTTDSLVVAVTSTFCAIMRRLTLRRKRSRYAAASQCRSSTLLQVWSFVCVSRKEHNLKHSNSVCVCLCCLVQSWFACCDTTSRRLRCNVAVDRSSKASNTKRWPSKVLSLLLGLVVFGESICFLFFCFVKIRSNAISIRRGWSTATNWHSLFANSRRNIFVVWRSVKNKLNRRASFDDCSVFILWLRQPCNSRLFVTEPRRSRLAVQLRHQVRG